MADQMLSLLRGIDSNLNLKYNKPYIGIEKDGRPYNFVEFRPRKSNLLLYIDLPRTNDHDEKIEDADLDRVGINRVGTRYNYRLRLTKDDIESKAEILKELSHLAYDNRRTK